MRYLWLVLLAACSAQDSPSILLEGRYDSRRIAIEIADEPAEHSKGLSGRDALAPNTGMLFIFPDDRDRTFWMRDTRFPLDIIFIDSAGAIVGIAERAKPHDETTLSVDAHSRYVLEIEGGLASRIGIDTASRINLPR